MNVPLPTGLLAGSWGAACSVVGAKDAPSIFASNLDINDIRYISLTRAFDRGHTQSGRAMEKLSGVSLG